MLKILPISDVRKKFSSLIKDIQKNSNHVIVTVNGRPKVVLVPYHWYESSIAKFEKTNDLNKIVPEKDK